MNKAKLLLLILSVATLANSACRNEKDDSAFRDEFKTCLLSEESCLPPTYSHYTSQSYDDQLNDANDYYVEISYSEGRITYSKYRGLNNRGSLLRTIVFTLDENGEIISRFESDHQSVNHFFYEITEVNATQKLIKCYWGEDATAPLLNTITVNLNHNGTIASMVNDYVYSGYDYLDQYQAFNYNGDGKIVDYQQYIGTTVANPLLIHSSVHNSYSGNRLNYKEVDTLLASTNLINNLKNTPLIALLNLGSYYTDFFYNSQGERVSEKTYQSGNSTLFNTTSYSYNSEGLLSNIAYQTDGKSSSETLSYDADGNPLTLNYYNPGGTLAVKLSWTWMESDRRYPNFLSPRNYSQADYPIFDLTDPVNAMTLFKSSPLGSIAVEEILL